jgi:hypothetical protein
VEQNGSDSRVRQPHSATFLPSPAVQGKRTFREVEKEMALKELRHMGKLAAAVREEPVVWATLGVSHIPW